MGKLKVESCPETGICSILREDGKKVDLIADEVEQIRGAAGDVEKIKSVLSEIDESFLEDLSNETLEQLSSEVG